MNKFAQDMPLLSKCIDGQRITYLDSASTTPKPHSVIAAIERYYRDLGANVHRGVHALSQETTDAYERARYTVAEFIGADPNEIIFTRNTTESINLLSYTLGLTKEDEVIFPASEHHSNFLPWIYHAKPVIMSLDELGIAKWASLKELITKRTKLISVGHVSNVTGVIAPIEEMTDIAHRHGIPILIDAAQSISHIPINVKTIGCDFMAFSSHKMFGPSGIGALYVNKERYPSLSLFNVGGGMVETNFSDRFIPKLPPDAFEAGTPAIEAALGFEAAVKYLMTIGIKTVFEHSQNIGAHCCKELGKIPGTKIIGGNQFGENRISICAFSLDNSSLTLNQLAQILSNSYKIMVACGSHCTHVLHHHMKLENTLRVSAHIYNSDEDIDHLIKAIHDNLF